MGPQAGAADRPMMRWDARRWLAEETGCPVNELELVDDRSGNQTIQATYQLGQMPYATLTGMLLDPGPGRQRFWAIDAVLEDGRRLSTDVRANRPIQL